MNSTFNKINELSQVYADLSARNLSKLVQIESLSCKEKSVQELLKQLMIECGADEVAIDGLGNCIGKMGVGSKILAIDGHMDTVDVGNMNNWDFDPFSGEIKNGFVHGRGSVDQKGGVASMLTSIKILKEIGVPDNLTIYFIGSVMEEDCDGLCWKYIVEEDKIKPDVVISTEPTNLNIYRGQRGRMEIQISFQGISSHGSAPERGKNAIYLASEAALRIKDLNNHLKHDDFLGKGSITISEIISDSPSLCAVADYAQIHIDRRLTWGETKDSAIKELYDLLQGLNAKITVPYYEEEAFTGQVYGMEKYYPTWVMEEDHQAIVNGIDAYKNLFKSDPKVDKWTFSTNGVTINGIFDIPIIGFGPGDEVMAHAPNEKIPIRDLQAASAFYAAYAYSF